MRLIDIAETVDCAGIPVNMEDKPSRLKIKRWKAYVEHAPLRAEDWRAHKEILAALNWIVENTGENDPRPPASFTQRLEEMT